MDMTQARNGFVVLLDNMNDIKTRQSNNFVGICGKEKSITAQRQAVLMTKQLNLSLQLSFKLQICTVMHPDSMTEKLRFLRAPAYKYTNEYVFRLVAKPRDVIKDCSPFLAILQCYFTICNK